MRRFLIALTLSLAVHAAAVAGVIAYGLLHALALVTPVKVEPVAIDLTRDLPLGPPAAKATPAAPEPPLRRRGSRPRSAPSPSEVVVPADKDAGLKPEERDAGLATDLAVHDGGGALDGGRRRPGDLRSFGPEGSRLVALLRLDRLRASPNHDRTIAALDELLLLLPDRRLLIEGSGLDLYRDFDSLLIATPDPRDASVTFLVARHHLAESAFRAGLERGAKAARRPITWRTIDGRPVGIRQRVPTSPNALLALDRDDRIIVLPQPSLAILATRAYALQLLGRDVLAPPSQAKARDTVDAGADGGAPLPRTPARVRWSDIVARIDAEDSAMPDDAVFMMTAANLFAAANAPSLVLPPTRGANEDRGTQAPPSGEAAVPENLALTVGLDLPFLALGADFKSEAAAVEWERELPKWRRKLLLNPVVLLGGFSPLLERTRTTREGSSLELRAESSSEELQRLLNFTANLMRAALARTR